MAFAEKLLTVQVALGKGSFGENGATIVNLSGYGVSATIAKVGAPDMDFGQIRIYGLSRSLMNQLSQISVSAANVRRNVVTVLAGDVNGKSLAFSGVITNAWPDMQAAPQTAFVIEARTGLLGQVKPVLPTSYPGRTDVAVIMKNLANQMGLAFEGNSVHRWVENPYLPGTARQQALAAADMADCYVVFENDSTPTHQGTLALVPIDGARGTKVPLIAPPPVGGMVGYPTYVGPATVNVKTLYNSDLRFLGNIRIQGSVIQQANGLWLVRHLSHSLEAGFPEAKAWFSDIEAYSMMLK